MKKSDIRKKILKIRKQNNPKNLRINFNYIFKLLKKEKKYLKTIGGYYPYNYEIDTMNILEKFEKCNYQISLPKIKKNIKWIFFIGQLEIHW